MVTMKYTEILSKNALTMPEILLPADKSDLSRWAVIACDQYTQDRSYWTRVAERAGNAPSTLKISFPRFISRTQVAPSGLPPSGRR